MPYCVWNVGSHIRSKPLPSLFGIAELEPSDSPGGLTHTKASMWEAANPDGAASGALPIPAPLLLHHSPRCWRRSTRPEFTIWSTVEPIALVGRSGPPQPLREVSIMNPILLGQPADTKPEYKPAAKSASLKYGFHS
ncbi:hypothetical protein D3C77_373320 [compost metagenome]